MPSAPPCQEKSISQRAQDGYRVLPQGWRWVRLGEVCDTQIEVVDPRRKGKGRFQYVDIASIDNARKRITQAKWLPCKEAPSRARRILKANDVIVATTRPYLNAVAIVPPELDGQIGSTGFCVLRALPGLDHEFLFAFVRSAVFIRGLSLRVKGALYPAVSNQVVREQAIPLPPLPEQERIGAILNERLATVERALAAVQAQLDSAKALPAAFLRRAFPKPREELGSGWSWVRLADKAEFLTAKSIASAGDATVRAITTACLSEYGFQPGGIKTARMWSHDISSCLCISGEILVARSNTPDLVGRASIYIGYPADIVATDLTIRIRTYDECDPQFLSGFLSSLFVRGFWKQNSGGASGSMKKIGRKQVGALCIPLPPLAEQKRIVARLNEQIAAAAELRKSLEVQLVEIETLPAALLRKAFSGGL